MSEVPATVESEHTPEPKWPEKVMLFMTTARMQCMAIPLHDDEQEQLFIKEMECTERPFIILRVTPPPPPVERRVEIDFGLVEASHRSATYRFSEEFQALILRHARIVEEPKP